MILIVYFSFSGNNEILAYDLAKDLDTDILQITEPKKRGMFRIVLDMLFNRFPRINELKIPWEKYNHVILLAPIWNYQIAHPMKSFLRKEKEHLKNYSFITLCSGRESQKEKIETQLRKLTTFKPSAVIEFEIRKLCTSEEQNVEPYKVTNHDLAKFKKEKEYQNYVENIRIKEKRL